MTTAALSHQGQIEAPVPTKQMGPIRHGIGSPKGSKHANDGSYASVEAMLSRLAVRCHFRVVALDLPMELADVRQEMDMSYLQAFKAWDPARGVKFSSYCMNACLNNFRNRIAKMIDERREMGMYSYDDDSHRVEDGDDAGDPLERLSSDMVDGDRPEDRLQARQEMREKLKGLTPSTQRFITALMLSQTRNLAGSSQKFYNVAALAGLAGPENQAELRRVKKEITQKFGFSQW